MKCIHHVNTDAPMRALEQCSRYLQWVTFVWFF